MGNIADAIYLCDVSEQKSYFHRAKKGDRVIIMWIAIESILATVIFVIQYHDNNNKKWIRGAKMKHEYLDIIDVFGTLSCMCFALYALCGCVRGGRGGETEREETFILSSRIKYLHISLNRFVLISYECDLIQLGRKWDKRHEAYISPLTSLLGNTLTRSHSLQLIQLHLSSCSLPPLVYSLPPLIYLYLGISLFRTLVAVLQSKVPFHSQYSKEISPKSIDLNTKRLFIDKHEYRWHILCIRVSNEHSSLLSKLPI